MFSKMLMSASRSSQEAARLIVGEPRLRSQEGSVVHQPLNIFRADDALPVVVYQLARQPGSVPSVGKSLPRCNPESCHGYFLLFRSIRSTPVSGACSCVVTGVSTGASSTSSILPALNSSSAWPSGNQSAGTRRPAQACPFPRGGRRAVSREIVSCDHLSPSSRCRALAPLCE